MKVRTKQSSQNRDTKPNASFLTWRFDTALQFSCGLHHDQARKGGSIPYFAHLLSVCGLVLEAGGDEDQAIAALLHDAVPTVMHIRQMLQEQNA